MIVNLFHGFCMALADSVPGVSGGTVAFILGFYERFINSLHSLFGKDAAARKAAFLYLVKLGLGWAAGLAASMLVLARLFESHIYFLSSAFLGLTLTSIPFIVCEEKESFLSWKKNWLFALLGAAAVCAMTFFRASQTGGDTLDFASAGPMQCGYIFLSGALAITAMVLPGVSGSTLLLIMGVYLPAIHAAREFLHFNLSVLPGLTALGLGILLGAAASVHFVKTALRKYRTQMLWMILGLLLGSLAAIVMGPTTLSAPKAMLSLQSFEPFGFLLGVAALAALEGTKKLAARRGVSWQRRAEE